MSPSPYRPDLIDVELVIEAPNGAGLSVIGTNSDWRIAMVDVMESAIKTLKEAIKKQKA
jgi:hypothetical protein